MTWKIKKLDKIKIKNPVLIEGLPGIGNVGKIAIDFLIDSLKAKKLFELTSNDLPHCVFVNEENLVELPSIDIYYKNTKERTILMLAGDIQPITETSCYEFCNQILDTFQKDKLKEIVTLGGIALPKVPTKPKVYCTGNSRKIINKYAINGTNKNMHGFIGPIIGVSGLLPGLAGKRNIPSAALLAETFGHPNYLGIKGAKELLKILNKELRLKVNVDMLNDEINDIEKEFVNIKKIKKAIAMSTKQEIVDSASTDCIG